MNNRITFISPDFDEDDDRGYSERDTEHYFHRNALLEYEKGDEEESGQREYTITYVMFTIHHDSKTKNITTRWKCLFLGQEYEINSIIPDKPIGPIYLKLKCRNSD